jgi:hypothetical protein
MIVPSQLALKTHTNFGCAASLATLDKLVDRFPLPPVAPPIGDTSLIHVMTLLAHSTVTNAHCDGTIFYNDPVQAGFLQGKSLRDFLGDFPYPQTERIFLKEILKEKALVVLQIFITAAASMDDDILAAVDCVIAWDCFRKKRSKRGAWCKA